MPARLTLDKAQSRLDTYFPMWRYFLCSDTWIAQWMQGSGDSRRTAFRMHDLAFEIADAEDDRDVPTNLMRFSSDEITTVRSARALWQKAHAA